MRHYFQRRGAQGADSFPLDLSAADGDPPDAASDADAGFAIIHTAAVGGRPRGALLSQAGMLTAQSSLAEAWRLDERDVGLGVLPLFHVAGLGLMLALQQAGGASIIAAKFDAARAARDIAAEKVTVMSEFAPMLGNIMDQAQPGQLVIIARRDGSGLRLRPSSVSRARIPMPTFLGHIRPIGVVGAGDALAVPGSSEVRGPALVLAQHRGRRWR